MNSEQTLTDFELEMLNLRNTARAVGFYAIAVLISAPAMTLILTSLIPTMSIAPLASAWLAACYTTAVSVLGASWLTLRLQLEMFASRRKQSTRDFIPLLLVSVGTMMTFVFAGSVIVVSVTEVVEAIPSGHQPREPGRP